MRFPALSLTCALAALVAPLGAAHAEAPATITVAAIELPKGETHIDLGDKGPSAGDMLVFNNPLVDKVGGTEIGRMNGRCIRTAVDKGMECDWTNIFKDGAIMASGYFLDSGETGFTVTGGTGRYAGYRGEVKFDFVKADEPAFLYTFILSK